MQDEEEVIEVNVFEKRKGHVVFQGKVSTDVAPNDFLHLRCFVEDDLKVLTVKQGQDDLEKVQSFKGLKSRDFYVRRRVVPIKRTAKVLFTDCEGVVRTSNSVPLSACVAISMYRLQDEEWQSVYEQLSLVDLEMISCNVKTFDERLGKLKHLTQLRLERLAELKSLSEALGELSSLTELHIEKCGIESLPLSIGQLKCLEKLRLFDLDELLHVPDEIGQLSNLKTWWIGSCKRLQRLPSTIGGLKRLEKLSLRDLKQLHTLPEELGHMSSLCDLWMGYCGIEHLPKSIQHLKQLRRLTLMSLININSLPEELGQVSNLRKLTFHGCVIQTLPKSIVELEWLKTINLTDLNKLKSLPEDMGRLSRLKKLRMHYCPLEQLPKSLKHLKLLKSIDLLWMLNLKLNHDDFAVFSRVKKLSLMNFEVQVKPLCEMLRFSTTLSFVAFNQLSGDEGEVGAALQQNGSIVDGPWEVASKYEDILDRNKANHQRALKSVLCLLAVKRCKRGLSLFPREMVEMISMMLWITRSDVDAWKLK